MTTASSVREAHASLTLLERLREQDTDSWERFCRIYAPFAWADFVWADFAEIGNRPH